MEQDHLLDIDKRLESIQQAGEESVTEINIVKNLILASNDRSVH